MAKIVVFRFKTSTHGEEEDKAKSSKTGLELVKATFRHMAKSENQKLLIPLTIWSGLEQGFFGADFTAVKDLMKCCPSRRIHLLL